MEQTVLWLNMTNGDRLPAAEVRFEGTWLNVKHFILPPGKPERWDLVPVSSVEFITTGTV